MSARDSTSPMLLVGLVVVVVGLGGAFIAIKQPAATPHPTAGVHSSLTDDSIAQGAPEHPPVRTPDGASLAAPSPMQTSVSSARATVPEGPGIDWERLVERAPEAALRQLKSAVPKDDSEAQRFGVYEVRALTQLQRMGEAQARAEDYFERWPSGPDTAYLQGLTGAHPRR